ncbi:DEAD/DEAH box helicase [Halomonas sp. M4R1S46]|uniref:DEAD/DEAH box helicase n=1 Tax=Halomonas sp. M4R1S46 TaxID=2982692 RepID=UPI0021E478D9|nr:DEAD/DEAH box helicase family protein [Halomonas sp. M4R1S46]UYG06853.1 DEAD/DEAH box helicase family protein [Halomonas sp. M4R1S46]
MNIQGTALEDKLWGALRLCQQESVKTAFGYLSKPKSEKSCLLSLPTGAGKSGVIATISHFSENNSILVLCHRRAVCDQLYREIKKGFFDKIWPDHSLVLKEVFNKVDDTSKNGIYVSTFQKLQTMSDEKFEALKRNIDVLVVDEGHSEPSPVWSHISRSLEKYKIIITATPYRNDLFQFDIDPKSSYIFTFKKALNDGVLRDPVFSTINEAQVLDAVSQRLVDQKGTVCIVKCDTGAEVERYYGLLSRKFKTLAIHDSFKGGDNENLKSSVPRKVAEQDWQVLVHQRKLDEGVDIPHAKTLVLTYPVSSGRELVQTVGRVVRIYDNYIPNVIEIDTGSNEKLWNNYRKFDESIADRKSSHKFLKSLNTASLIDSYLEAFPEYSYFDSSFKKRFNLKEFDPESSLNIPLASVCFVKKSSEFTLPAMMDEMYWQYTKEGDLVERREDCCGAEILLSVSFNNSKLLKYELFFQPSFEVLVVRELDDLVAIYDSRSQKYSYRKELGLGAAVNVDELLKMASREERTRTKEAHTIAITSAETKPAGMSMKSGDLEKTITDQAHSTYAFTTLKVDNIGQDNKRRSSYYLGMGSGRVSDQKVRNFSLPRLMEWIDDAHKVMNSTRALKSSFLNSFSKPVYEIPENDPVSILFDFSHFDTDVEVFSGSSQYSIGPGFQYAEYNGGVDLIGSGDRYLVFYDEKEERLKFEGNESVVCPQYQKSWLEILNGVKIKALYPNGLTYADGNFFRVRLPSQLDGKISETKLGGALIPLSELSSSNLSEKDSGNVQSDEFSQYSIFYFIDKLKFVSSVGFSPDNCGPFYQYIPNVDLILCSDMGVEHSDFVLSSSDKLVFVHVKCGDSENPGSAAGSIAEVGGQAIKNIEHAVSHDLELKPGNYTNLLSHWPTVNSNPFLQERVRLYDRKRFDNPQDDQNVREGKVAEVQKCIASRRRSSAVRKEIWIVVGNGFSKKHFVQQFEGGSPAAPTSLQAYQLLDSWMSTAAGLDIEVKFFVSP